MDTLRLFALDICLHLKGKQPRWERFLTKRGNLKATKFIKLEAYLLDTFRKTSKGV